MLCGQSQSEGQKPAASHEAACKPCDALCCLLGALLAHIHADLDCVEDVGKGFGDDAALSVPMPSIHGVGLACASLHAETAVSNGHACNPCGSCLYECACRSQLRLCSLANKKIQPRVQTFGSCRLPGHPLHVSKEQSLLQMGSCQQKVARSPIAALFSHK